MQGKLFAAQTIAKRFSPVSEKTLHELSCILYPKIYAKGEHLLHEGDVCHTLFFVQSGLLRKYFYRGKQDVTEHFTKENQLSHCLESFLQKKPTKMMLQALEESKVYHIPRYEFFKLVEFNPEVEKLYRKILEHIVMSNMEYSASSHFETATERYQHLLENDPDIILRAPMHNIASYLKMSPETLSRVRNHQ